MDCQDRARDLMTKNNNDSAKVRTEMENCFITCADTHIALLPTMDKRIRESLAKMK
ncbi:hypothetical protein FSP39_010624 [Pinctada imbricata]|uniref:Protein FAM136A n=1 Tax=Pinctada imbricata TaxID=66713 RepID=A0AA88Y659_PINIB|nr:hypothetical protein FSP39_010624 [Pinctada imbricata]